MTYYTVENCKIYFQVQYIKLFLSLKVLVILYFKIENRLSVTKNIVHYNELRIIISWKYIYLVPIRVSIDNMYGILYYTYWKAVEIQIDMHKTILYVQYV